MVFPSLVSALFVASAAARFAPRSAEPPMRLADRQSAGFATIEQAQDGSIPRFEWEKTALTDETIDDALASVSADAKSLFRFASHNVVQDAVPETDKTFNGRECKVFPGDDDWPVEDSWAALNDVIDGALMKPKPQAHICYDNGTNSLNQAACDAMTEAWTDPFYQLDDPIEMLTPLYQGNTCQPPQYYDSEGCTQGGYSLYVVNASTTAQIQLAINFARNTGIRLVVRNTGHDFAGKSGGAGSLSVWTHGLKDIAFIEKYESDDYTGPAMKAGSGAQGFELYAAARDFGGTVMGGECPTVGAMGGWIQGGGHSPLSGSLGLGADHVLSMEVVTTDGRYVTADKDNNPELFWALRGGGGLTYGVVTSVTVKVHQDQPIASANWLISTSTSNVSVEAFKQGLKAYWKYFPQNADNNTYAYWKVFPSATSISMDMSPFFAPGKTVEEAKALIDPWIKDMAALGISVEPEWTQYSGFYDAYNGSFPVETVMSNGVASTSRMIPRSNWANESITNETFEAIWQAVDEGMALIGYNMAPSYKKGGCPNNSVNPAWRDMVGFIISGKVLNMSEPVEEIIKDRLNMTNGVMQKWREITPGSGSYLSEGDRLEPNFQWSFYGSFYPRLLEAKRKFDPFNLFWATGAVGSEFFDVKSFDGLPNENGRLCVKPDPKLYYAEGPDFVPE